MNTSIPSCGLGDLPAAVASRDIDVSVVIPTYCEAENLRDLIPMVHHALERAEIREEIIVVDDNSPDATQVVCRELAAQYPMRLLVRTDVRGLSSAVVHGMKNASGEIIVVMDADHSHPPDAIPDLVSGLVNEKADFVIGSRYVQGGGTDDDWGMFRWLNSRVATLLARPLTAARDPMAGFFAIRRDTVNNASNLSPIGYKIGLELIVKCGCRHIYEVPIHFKDRLCGDSKLTLREQLNYLRHLKRLYEFKLGHAARPLQFALVGASGAGIDLLCLKTMLAFSPLSFSLARGLSIWIAMTWNFWLNRRLTFSHARSRAALPQYLKFVLSCGLGAVANWAVSTALWTYAPQLIHSPMIAAVFGILAGMGFNYTLSATFVFGK